MATVTIRAETGRTTGSRPSRRLRRSGRVPAVVYGMGIEPLSVSVDYADLRAAFTTKAGLNALISLNVDGNEYLSIVKDLQRHPVRREVLHVDFLRIDSESKVEVEVPLVLIGDAVKVTQASGMVDQVLHHLQVRSKIDVIPAEVTADVSKLQVGGSLRVSDIEFPSGVETVGDPEATIAVGMITRSTKEYLRQQQALEAEAEAVAYGDAVPISGESGAGSAGTD